MSTDKSAKKELLGGVAYTALAKYVGIFINLIVTGILARILSPSDFGVVAIATVIINFFSMLSDMGIGPAIIQNRGLTKNDLNNIFSVTFFIGVVLTAIFYFSSSCISSLYGNNQLDNIIKFFSVAIIFHCIDIVPNSLLKRDKRFQFVAVTTLIIQIACGVISAVAAYAGVGIYSLLIQPLLSSVLIFIVDYSQYTLKVVMVPRYSSIRKIISYSVYQFLFSFINYFSRNIDKLIGGRTFGVVELGYYDKSYRLMMLPVGNLSHVIVPAIQPVFAKYQDNKEWLFTRSMQLFRVLTVLGFPLTALLFFASEEIVILVFGEQWYNAVPVFQVLSLSVGLQIVYSPQGAFFQSANAVKEMFYCGLVTAGLNIIAVVVGCYFLHSVIGMAWLIDIAYMIAFFVVYFVMLKRVFYQPFKKFLEILIEPAVLTITLAFSLYIFTQFCVVNNLLLSAIMKGSIYVTIMCLYELKSKLFRNMFRR